ncbi:hypothetical protein FIC_01797 [Flavobacteriaceae bacterium 3519-10]|nr:hypothetical protein FIC_01797 [Flavobacteriaceae bacterium 3519-10]
MLAAICMVLLFYKITKQKKSGINIPDFIFYFFK